MQAAQFRRIEAGDAFEAAWLAGARPSVEEHPARAAPEDQAALLSAPMRLGVEYRCKAGETPRLDEYQARFPGHAAHLGELISDARRPSTPDLPGSATSGCGGSMPSRSWPRRGRRPAPASTPRR